MTDLLAGFWLAHSRVLRVCIFLQKGAVFGWEIKPAEQLLPHVAVVI